MLNRGDVVLIDLGSVVDIGAPVVEYTQFYALDASTSASTIEFDRNCLVTTLLQCCEPTFEVKSRTSATLRESLQHSTSRLVTSCLHILDCNSFADAMAMWKMEVVDPIYCGSRAISVSMGK